MSDVLVVSEPSGVRLKDVKTLKGIVGGDLVYKFTLENGNWILDSSRSVDIPHARKRSMDDCFISLGEYIQAFERGERGYTDDVYNEFESRVDSGYDSDDLRYLAGLYGIKARHVDYYSLSCIGLSDQTIKNFILEMLSSEGIDNV